MPDPANGKRSEGVLGKPRPSGRGGVTAEFFVGGIPCPQGSKSVSRTGHMYESSKGLPAWRKTVAMTAMAWKAKQPAKVQRALPLDGPLWARCYFYLPRPKRPKHPDYPIGPPDLDKCVRAVGDALTQSGVIIDDARIVTLGTAKIWADDSGERPPGCLVRLGVMEE